MADNKTNWTSEQLEAISDPSSDILVSAAAGSGKTAVLTERMIRKLTDPVSPLDISRILVVTFTEDAANELKERIRDALLTAMAENPSSEALKRQYLRLPAAKISTIHGFCLDLIRSNYELLGLSPKLRVSDESQNSLLMQQVADSVVDGYYAALPDYSDIDDFVSFADNFITLQDTSLTSKMIDIYKDLQSFPEGIDFLRLSYENYSEAEDDFSDSVWGRILFSYLYQVFSYYKAIFEDACNVTAKYDEIKDKYLPSFDSSITAINKVLSALESKNYQMVKDAVCSFSQDRMASKRGFVDDEALAFYKSVRKDAFAEDRKEIINSFFTFSPEVIKATAAKSRNIVSDFYKLLSSFDRRFSYEKRRRGIIDFNDMERMAYSLLVNPDGSYTSLASELSKQYDEVCIDEYQDVNSLQDGIFKAVTRTTHRFMVGDIKQSIYRFRGAEPNIFSDYRTDTDVKLISLTHNFRSDKPVIDFANEICGTLFRSFGKTVPYDKSDELYFDKKSDECQPPEIIVIDKKSSSEEENPTDSSKKKEDKNFEALYVAKRIFALIKDGVEPKDIAILLRSAKATAKDYEDALSSYGIQSKNKEQKDLFSNPEVMLLMCVLNVIDNPSRDVYLAGALKSPIYNVSLSELAMIRQHGMNMTLYDALKRYTEDYGFSKGEFFLRKLDEYRKLANEPVDKLIWHIYCDSGLLAYASENKLSFKSGKENLIRLYEKARSFESGSFKGLYNFIRYINDILNSDTKTPSPASAEENDIVQIMTIHKSKGLQFKYVFICGTASAFNTIDEASNIIIDKVDNRPCASIKLTDQSGLAAIDTLFRRIAKTELHRKNLEEQMRVLYVALTRAKSKVIVVGSVKDASRLRELELYKGLTDKGNGYIFSKKATFLNWILLSNSSVEPTVINAESIEEASLHANEGEVQAVTYDEELVNELTSEFRQRFDSYNKSSTANIPAKLSVSELYPTILDSYDDSSKADNEKKAKVRAPRFIDESDTRGAAIGTATHQFMQFCDFRRLSEGIDKEIERMTALGFLSPSVSSLVNRSAIRRFTESELYSSLINAKTVRRELRFNVHLKASSFATGENKAKLGDELVLVQGIIDCIYESADGKTVLLDYKTDRIGKDKTPLEAEEELISRHLTQLSYYYEACKSLIGKEADEIIIYSFALGKSISIPKDRLLKL